MARVTLKYAVVGCCLLLATSAISSTVSMKLSGAGKVNDSTIKAGEKVSLDIYFDNDKPRMGISIGFKISSPDQTVATIVHPADSGKGMDETAGDVKGHNGFEAKAIFDLLNKPIFADWDGKLPDQVGFMAHIFKKTWQKHPVQKCYSIDLIVPTAGTIVVDTAFFPPAGRWLLATSANETDFAAWKGPYKFKIVK